MYPTHASKNIFGGRDEVSAFDIFFTIDSDSN